MTTLATKIDHKMKKIEEIFMFKPECIFRFRLLSGLIHFQSKYGLSLTNFPLKRTPLKVRYRESLL